VICQNVAVDHMVSENSKLQSAVRRLTEALNLSAQVICVLSLAFLFIALTANVVLRYAFGSGLSWAYDVHVIVFPWMIAGGVVLASVRGGHIAITLLRDALHARLARVLYILVCLIVALVAVTVIWSSFPVLKASQFQKIMALGGISQFWGYLSLVYAFGCITLISGLDILSIAMTGADLNKEMAPAAAHGGN
jgi:TRAP-type transport system small permease protein